MDPYRPMMPGRPPVFMPGMPVMAPYPMGHPFGMPPGMPPGMPRPPYPMPMMPGGPPMYPGMPMPPVPLMKPPDMLMDHGINGMGSFSKPIEEKSTQVYVGKIAATIEDDFIRKLLESCGKVVKWSRYVDPVTEQPKPFGFVDYENAEGVLRALRLLNNLGIDGNQLQVKVDQKTQKYIDSYVANKQELEKLTLEKKDKNIMIQKLPEPEKAEQEEGEVEENQEIERDQKQEDERVHMIIQKMVEERKSQGDELSRSPSTIDDIEKKKEAVVTREIKLFRERQAQKDREKLQKKIEDEEMTEEEKLKEVEKKKEREKELREREKEREKLRDARRKEKEREDEMLFTRREKEFEQREKDREKERERVGLREKDRLKERQKEIEREQAESEKETLEDERKRRARERARDSRKRRFRDREKEEDEYDRKKEVEDQELSKRRDEEYRMQIDHGSDYRHHGYYYNKNDSYNPLSPNPLSPSNEESGDSFNNSPQNSSTGDTFNLSVGKKLGFGFSAVQNPIKKQRLAAAPGFNAEVEELIQPKKKLPLVRLDYDDDKTGSLLSITGSPLSGSSSGEKKRLIQQQKSLIDKIPTATVDLYAYPVNWPVVDEQQLVSKKMRPWVTRKIVEYLGEEEASLIDFILSKISEHVAPKDIQDQLALVLEEEAEVFTVRLWRMLIFEVMRAESDSAK